MKIKIDVRTQKEKEREKKHKDICDEYQKIRQQLPELKEGRIMLSLAIKFDMTVPGIRNILIKNKLYTLKKKSYEQI